MDTETIHVAIRSWDTVSSHCPEESVQSTRLLTEEVPCGIMSSGSLWNFFIWAWLDSMDQIWKQDGVLDEEDRYVIPHNI